MKKSLHVSKAPLWLAGRDEFQWQCLPRVPCTSIDLQGFACVQRGHAGSVISDWGQHSSLSICKCLHGTALYRAWQT